MKISYRTHPVLHILNDRSKVFGLFDDDRDWAYNLTPHGFKAYYNQFRRLNSAFERSIKYLTAPFVDAIEACIPKLEDSPELDNLKSSAGTILYLEHTFCYDFINRGDGEWEMLLYWFMGDKLFGIYDKRGGEPFSWRTNVLDNDPLPAVRYRFQMEDRARVVYLILAFLQFVPVEVRELQSGEKSSNIACITGKTKNESPYKIEIMDSKYMTTLVRSEGFSVRGHLRWQAHGPAKSLRRLQWIDPHVRHGYTAPARKLNEEYLASPRGPFYMSHELPAQLPPGTRIIPHVE